MMPLSVLVVLGFASAGVIAFLYSIANSALSEIQLHTLRVEAHTLKNHRDRKLAEMRGEIFSEVGGYNVDIVDDEPDEIEQGQIEQGEAVTETAQEQPQAQAA